MNIKSTRMNSDTSCYRIQITGPPGTPPDRADLLTFDPLELQNSWNLQCSHWQPPRWLITAVCCTCCVCVTQRNNTANSEYRFSEWVITGFLMTQKGQQQGKNTGDDLTWWILHTWLMPLITVLTDVRLEAENSWGKTWGPRRWLTFCVEKVERVLGLLSGHDPTNTSQQHGGEYLPGNISYRHPAVTLTKPKSPRWSEGSIREDGAMADICWVCFYQSQQHPALWSHSKKKAETTKFQRHSVPEFFFSKYILQRY